MLTSIFCKNEIRCNFLHQINFDQQAVAVVKIFCQGIKEMYNFVISLSTLGSNFFNEVDTFLTRLLTTKFILINSLYSKVDSNRTYSDL